MPPAPVSRQARQAVVCHLNEPIREVRSDLEFSISIDKATDRSVVKINDAKTREVVRQIPPQDILSLDHRLQQLAGLLLRARA
ncbi:flagellar protein FlaG [bacterium BMS3Abin12]|nr:flagellar protein FlaG [bacterium BMS3Abin12]